MERHKRKKGGCKERKEVEKGQMEVGKERGEMVDGRCREAGNDRREVKEM